MALRRLEPRGPHADEASIGAFEKMLGARLPFDYREFLLEWNGGVPVPDAFSYDGLTSIVARFHSIGAPNPLHDLASRHDVLRIVVPLDLLPIATDLATNVVCLGIGGERAGHVYYVSTQRDLQLTRRRPQPIAVNLAAFLRDLFSLRGGGS